MTPTGGEIKQLRPITTDAKFNQHLKVFGGNYTNVQRLFLTG